MPGLLHRTLSATGRPAAKAYRDAAIGHRLVMYIGLGIILLVLGLILALDVITVDLEFVNDDMLGTILIVAGVLAIVLSLLIAPPWRRERPVDRYDDRI